jgi:FKBP-type peptidyl-prolyl cis-trans isomerase 2
MDVKKNDFVEIEFTGKILITGEIFDTNIKSDAEKAGLETKNLKPFVLSVGNKMLPKGFDLDLDGREIGKDYSVECKPEDAFGKRDPQMVRMIPTKLFHEQKINPQRGMQITLDGQLVKVLSSSGGRTLIDFNNPLSGKKVSYNYKINKKITDLNEKVNALQDFLFRRRFDFDLDEKKVTFNVGKEFEQFVKMFSGKFEELVGLKIDSKLVDSDSSGNEVESEVKGSSNNKK